MAEAAPTRTRRALLVHPFAELYGSDRVFLETVRAMVEDGWSVTVALPERGLLGPLVEEAGADLRLLPMPVLRKAFLSPRGLVVLAAQTARRLPAMVRVVRKARPDAVYLSTVTSPMWAVVARLLRRPLLVHVHEAEADVRRVLRLALAAPLLLARRVVANSELSRSVLVADLPRLARRTSIVYNGVPGPTGPVTPLPAEVGPVVRLVLVGRLSPRKGSDVAVAALERLRANGIDARLSLVGAVFAGYEWFEEGLREQVEQADLADAVTFAGERREVWSAFDSADIALVPSRVEPFGNVAVEAMLAGRPVVASAAQGLVEVVSSPELGELVPADDPAALADAVQRLLGDWPAARDRAEAARADAARRFAPQRYRTDIAAALTSISRH